MNESNELEGGIRPPVVFSLLLACVSLFFATYIGIVNYVGYFDASVWMALARHPEALAQFVAGGFGGSLFHPLLVLGFLSFFKKNRNLKTFCYVLSIGSAITLLINLITYFS
jgi:hypothetical protein